MKPLTLALVVLALCPLSMCLAGNTVQAGVTMETPTARCHGSGGCHCSPCYCTPCHCGPSYRPPCYRPPCYRPPCYEPPCYRPPCYRPPCY